VEGIIIGTDKVGEYVNYVIRFENTGTSSAENIVVSDYIDLSKFVITTLLPINASHSFITKISNGNKVEFIFENINLPFDDANNDGFIAFKIKTKPTLVVNDVFTNKASIYFDYNFPIVTNTASTTVQALSKQDFMFSNYFNVYPNPVQNILNINSQKLISVKTINVYNNLGQLVQKVANPNFESSFALDVSKLQSGHYFLNIVSDKGSSTEKFIKN